MTEEIIIDGVDVAGCISFDKNNGYNICCYDDTREDKIPFANFCEENKNCYYKQLKRLEKENKELKEINEALILEAEDVAEARMEICNQCGNRDDYNIPCKMIRDLDYGLTVTVEERDKYEHALEEIREIVYNSPIVKTVGNAPMVYYSDYANKRNEILDTINKVLESEENNE